MLNRLKDYFWLIENPNFFPDSSQVRTVGTTYLLLTLIKYSRPQHRIFKGDGKKTDKSVVNYYFWDVVSTSTVVGRGVCYLSVHATGIWTNIVLIYVSADTKYNLLHTKIALCVFVYTHTNKWMQPIIVWQWCEPTMSN